MDTLIDGYIRMWCTGRADYRAAVCRGLASLPERVARMVEDAMVVELRATMPAEKRSATPARMSLATAEARLHRPAAPARPSTTKVELMPKCAGSPGVRTFR